MTISYDIIILVFLFCIVTMVILLLVRRKHAQGGQNLLDLRAQISHLSKLFETPRFRGYAGERLLENILTEILPRNMFSLQHRFPDGRVVDAVVRFASFLIPIDAKFPLESLRPLLEKGNTAKSNAVIKKCALDIAQKYLRPKDHTSPYAFMYLPSESLYYALFVANNATILKEITERRVIPVGPSSLFLYLHTMGTMIQDMRLSKEDSITLKMFSQLKQDTSDCIAGIEKTGLSLRHLQNNVSELTQKIRSIESTLDTSPSAHD